MMDQMNPMAPTQPGEAPPNPIAQPSAPAQAQAHPIVAAANAQVAQASAQLKKMKAAAAQFKSVKAGLQSLTELGDSITSDDVIEEMGKLVADGMTPEPLIALMAGDPTKGQPPMPDSGQALAGWVAQHSAQLAQVEGQFAQAHQQAAHSAATTAIQSLMIHHIESTKKGQPAMATPSSPLLQ